MKNRRWLRVVAPLAIGAVLVLYSIGRVRADGIPTSQPLWYSGYLEQNGVPVDASTGISVTLWDQAANGNSVCQQPTGSTAVSKGRFRISLPTACKGAIQANPDLWVEVVVNNTDYLPRTKIAAVPYAVEADRASNAVGALDARINALVPPGTIVAYAGSTAPPGWLLCDGSALDRAAYPALYAAIGVNWGNPNSTQFNLPDLRGRFLRGLSADAGAEDCGLRTASAGGGVSGCAVGTVQGDDLLKHSHSVPWAQNTGGTSAGVTSVGSGLNAVSSGLFPSSGGNETRPKNVAVIYLVKS